MCTDDAASINHIKWFLSNIYSKKKFRETSNLIGSALYLGCWSFGDFLGPLIFGALNDVIGFEKSCFLLASIQVIFLLFYFIYQYSNKSNKIGILIEEKWLFFNYDYLLS